MKRPASHSAMPQRSGRWKPGTSGYKRMKNEWNKEKREHRRVKLELEKVKLDKERLSLEKDKLAKDLKREREGKETTARRVREKERHRDERKAWEQEQRNNL